MRRLLVALFLLSPLAACNTIAGFGQDVEAVGGALEDAADDARD